MHVAQIVAGMATSDGAGVRLTRMVGTREVDMIDPFLMLDRFDNEDPKAYIGGFPDHPHRGFETVTVMLDGRMRHRDSTGGEGVIGPGDVQWMTAGRGIVHSEMPEQIDGRMRGFQLWVNLPAALKMTAPGYQDIQRDTIPVVEDGGVRVQVIAGQYGDATGPAQPRTPMRVLMLDAQPNTAVRLEPAPGHNAFLCVYEGEVTAPDAAGNPVTATAPSLMAFDGTGDITVTAGDAPAAMFYCDGEPIAEPVARYGPFVMNSRNELMQAVEDFQAGKFGK